METNKALESLTRADCISINGLAMPSDSIAMRRFAASNKVRSHAMEKHIHILRIFLADADSIGNKVRVVVVAQQLRPGSLTLRQWVSPEEGDFMLFSHIPSITTPFTDIYTIRSAGTLWTWLHLASQKDLA